MTEIVSRRSALACGLNCYFTGKPCPHGHIAERRVSSFACVKCSEFHNRSLKARENNLAYRKANAERIRLHKIEYAKRTSVKNVARATKWQKENVEKRRAIMSKWCRDNRGKIRASARKWYRDNPEKARAKQHKRL